MDTIIGLGSAGCNIADKFSVYKQYSIYKIDVGLKGLKKDGIYDMPWQCDVERYEDKCPNMKNFFKNVKGEVLFIVSGAGNISGTTLRALECLKHCEINVLYIETDLELLQPTKKAQERTAYYVLQEYARSGVFKNLYLVSNIATEEHLGDVPLNEYYDRINDMIVSTMHMLNVYNHIDSESDTFGEIYETARVATVGLLDFENNDLKTFFPLDKIKETRYYYAINKEKIETDGTLFKKIRKQVKEASKEVKTSYGIFSTNYEEDYGYVVQYSPSIQYREKEKLLFS